MNDSIKASLAALWEAHPRGPTPGNCVEYTSPNGEERVLRVVASQRWDTGDQSLEVGLVWAGLCDTCDTRFWQVTPVREIELHTECEWCDLVGGRTDRIEITAAVKFIGRVAPKGSERPRVQGARRRGRVENHVLEIAKDFGADTIRLPDLIAKAVETMVAPAPDERDSRRQRVVRSIQQLAKEVDGPLALRGDLVVLFE